jgi:anthranilate phosphoribosyltransferase
MKEFIEKCIEGHDLTTDEAAQALELIMTNQATESQIAGLLVALRAKGESEDELVGFVRTMRDHAVKIAAEDPDAIDMCGTGGDGMGTFNISTVSAIVAAGAGVTVAKHGNRSVSSRSGSADLFTALGVNVQLRPERVEACVNEVGIGFLFAPLFHPAMKYAAKSRQEMGIRTIFNMVGPMTNPAGVRRQVVGTYNPTVAGKIAGALKTMNTERAYVLHGGDGMDEVSLDGETHIHDVRGVGAVRRYPVDAGHFGLQPAVPGASHGGDPAENAAIAMSILNGEPAPGRDVVLANAALGIHVAGKAADLKEATRLAEESIDSGRARSTLQHLVEFTQRP